MGRAAQKADLLRDEALPRVAIWDRYIGDVAYQVVEPGLIDSRARYAYSNGQCAALAVALHDHSGGDIYMTVARSGDIYHVGALTAPGVITDIYGSQGAHDWVSDQRFSSASDPIARVERISRQQALQLPRFLPQSVEVARAFVLPLLAQQQS